jgi:hypothetical protein
MFDPEGLMFSSQRDELKDRTERAPHAKPIRREIESAVARDEWRAPANSPVEPHPEAMLEDPERWDGMS